MVAREGLLVVERIEWFGRDAAQVAAEPTPSLQLSHPEILMRYRGIDGEPWPDCPKNLVLRDGLGLPDDWDAITGYVEAHSASGVIDFLYVRLGERAITPLPAGAPRAFRLLGFDVGFYNSEVSTYSVIYHEVIYGTHAELRECSAWLNDSLLLETDGQVETLQRRCTELADRGVALEDAAPMIAIAVYGTPRPTSAG